MKYVAPYGSGDPNAPYVNGNPSTGVAGSIPPAAAFEHPLRELVALISKSGLTPDENVLTQVAQAIRGQKMNYRAAGGSANAITVTLDPPIASYAELISGATPLAIKSGAGANTGAMTLNVDGLGAVAVTWPDGTAMAAGDWPASTIGVVRHDGTAFRYMAGRSPTQTTADQRKVAPINFIATWSASLSNSVQTQLTGVASTVQSNLDDATFSSGIFTAGARTAGTWLAAMSMISPTANVDIFAGIYDANPGGTGVGYSTTETTTSAPGTVALAVLPRAAGEVLRFTARQSSGGSLTCSGRITLVRLGA